MVVKLILITCHYNLQGIDKERSWMEQNTEKDSISEHFLPHRVTDEGHPDYHSRLWRPTTSCWTRSLPSIPQHYYYVHLCVDLESILSWWIFQVTVRSWVAIPIFPIDHLQWEYLNVFKLIVIGLVIIGRCWPDTCHVKFTSEVVQLVENGVWLRWNN